MANIVWDAAGEKAYETGVDRGTLFVWDPAANSGAGGYGKPVPWNGLTTVTETPSGGDANPQYADNIKYLNLLAVETFGLTIEAFTYPDEFGACDGTVEPYDGVKVGQQDRAVFGFSYRTKVGNDADGSDAGYKLHLVYGCQAAPSQKAYATVNDKPSAIAFSWDVTTTPVSVTGHKPTSLIVVDSTVVADDDLASLEAALYNTTTGTLPLPDAVIAMFAPGGGS
jgi:hypothetical protein